MMAAIISLTNCQTQTEPEATPARTVRISLSTGGTKTANFMYSTHWAEGDEINLYHFKSSAPSVQYVNDGKFTLVEGAGTSHGVFEGPAFELEDDAEYTFYSVYPYRSAVTDPTGESSYRYIGNKSSLIQDCAGNNHMAHLCGSECPLYGVAYGVTSEKGPTFAMKNLASVIWFRVWNTTGKRIKVLSVQLKEDQPIVGQFNIDISSGEPVYTAVEQQSISNPVIKLENSDWIENERYEEVYLPVAPFTHDISKPLDVTIIAEDEAGAFGTCTIEMDAFLGTDNVQFHPGKIKYTKVRVTSINSTAYDTVADVLASTDNNISYCVNDALVTMVYASGFFVQDETGTVLVYMGSVPTVKVGDKVRLTGTASTYSNIRQYNKPMVEVLSSDNPVSLVPVGYSGADVDAAAATPTAAYVSLVAEFTFVGAAANKTSTATVADATATLSAYPGTDPEVTFTLGGYMLEGYVYGCHNGSVIFYAASAERLPYLTVSPSVLSFSAVPAGPQVVAVSSDSDGWYVVSCPAWIEVDDGTVEGTLSISVTENTGEARTANVVLKHVWKEILANITVNQSAPAGDAQDGDILWQEDFTGYSTLPATASGDHVYGGATVTYATVSSTSDTKLYDATLAGGTAPEILIAKNNGSLTVGCIPTGSVSGMTLTYKTNNDYLTITPSEGVTVLDGSTFKDKVKTVYLSVEQGTDSFSLEFLNENSGNCRVDNFMLVAGLPVLKENQDITFDLSEAVSWTIGTDCTLGVAQEGPTVTGNMTPVTYSSSNTDIATVNATTGVVTPVKAGTVTITATAEESDEYYSATDSYTLTIIDPSASGTTVTAVIADIAAANGWANQTKYEGFSLDEVVSVSVAGGNNTGKYYETGATWRVYQNESPVITVSLAEGHSLISIRINYASKNNGVLTYGTSQITTGTLLNVSGSSAEFGVGNTSTNSNGNIQITKIEVTYE